MKEKPKNTIFTQSRSDLSFLVTYLFSISLPKSRQELKVIGSFFTVLLVFTLMLFVFFGIPSAIVYIVGSAGGYSQQMIDTIIELIIFAQTITTLSLLVVYIIYDEVCKILKIGRDSRIEEGLSAQLLDRRHDNF